jgi:hypothetical protein
MKKIIFLAAFLSANFLSAQDCDPGSAINVNFESAIVPALPDCTVAINNGSGNNWKTINNPGNGFDSNTLYYEANGQPADAWFFTKGINMTAGTYYKISYKYGNDNVGTTESLIVTMGATPTIAAAATFTSHTTITGGVPALQNIELYQASATGTVYFGFHATSAANQGNLYVDDIVIEPVVCGTPTNIQITDITQTEATVSWSAPTGSNISVFSVYQYAITETDTPPADGISHPATSIDLTGLEPGTTYYVFNRSLCGPVWSDWTDSIAFTTPCEATTVPYLLNFESATVPGFPDCTIAIPGTTGNDWVTVNNPGNGFTSNTLQYSGNAEAADAWLFTQGIELTAGTFYKVSYKYGNNSAGTTEKLRVTLGTEANEASVTGNFAEHETVTGGTQAQNSVEFFNVPASGVYVFGFNAYSEASQGSLYVDDFLIEELECGVPSNISITNITDTSATVTWQAPTTGNSTLFSVYQYAYSTTNTPPAEGTFEPAMTTNLSGLTPETTYYLFTRTQCGPIWSDWTSTPFTTDEALGTGNNKLNGFSYYPNPVKDVLNLTSSSAINKVNVYTITGQLVYTRNGSSQNEVCNLSQLTGGVYLVTIYTENETNRIKIVKE